MISNGANYLVVPRPPAPSVRVPFGIGTTVKRCNFTLPRKVGHPMKSGGAAAPPGDVVVQAQRQPPQPIALMRS
jgi:hypothetical protein